MKSVDFWGTVSNEVNELSYDDIQKVMKEIKATVEKRQNCEHEFEYIGKIPMAYDTHLKIYKCEKCGTTKLKGGVNEKD